MKMKSWFIVGTVFNLVTLLGAQGLAPVNPSFTQWQRRHAIESREEAESSMQKRATVVFAAEDKGDKKDETIDLPGKGGARPTLFDRSYLGRLNNRNVKPPVGGFPKRYDLRELGWVTPVKFQGDFGTCWAHAALASLESWILKSEGVALDLSENNLANWHGGDWPFAFGGNASRAEAYLLRWDGPILESDDAYPHPRADEEDESSDLSPVRHVQRTRWIIPRTSATDNDTIKDALMQFGALCTSHHYTSHKDAYNPSTAAYYLPEKNSVNHAVVIVGWDDDYPRENFVIEPPGDGAFIVKNSLSDKWGDEGYCYISYYDDSLGYSDITSFSNAEPVDNYARIYQYDKHGVVGAIEPKWGANMFTAMATETISAVGFYAMVPNTHYMITVYRNCDVGDPESGEVVVKNFNGSVDYAGFTTIPLPEGVEVEEGSLFSVVVKLVTPSYEYPHAVEFSYPGYTSAANAQQHQSFYSHNGARWEDLYAYKTMMNLCIKAYSESANYQRSLLALQIEGVDTITTEGSATYTATAVYSDNSRESVLPTWSIDGDTAVATITAEGLLTTQKVLTNTTIVLCATYTEEGIEKTAEKEITITVAAPTTPENFTASMGSDTNGILLEWEPVIGAESYAIYRGTTESATNAGYLGTTTEARYFDADVIPGVDTYYFVKAKNSTGSSPLTAFAKGWRALAAPLSLTASDGTSSTEVSLTWSASTGATYYRLYRANALDEEPVALTDWITSFRYSDTQVVPGQTYLYYVRAALDATGKYASELSVVEEGFVFEPIVLRAIEIVGEASVNANTSTTYTCKAWYTDGSSQMVSATWTIEGLPGAEMDASTGTLTTPILAANTPLFVMARYSEEDIEQFDRREVLVLAVTPSQPTTLRVEAQTTDDVRLAWEAVEGAASYEIWRAVTSDSTTAIRVGTTDGTSYSDDATTPGVTYFYWLKAVNSGGVSDFSTVTVTATRTLSAPTGVSATNGTEVEKVALQWQAVLGASLYRVLRATSAEGPFEPLCDWQTALTYDDTSAEMGVDYYYVIQATNALAAIHVSGNSDVVCGAKEIVNYPVALTIVGPATIPSGESAGYTATVIYDNGHSLPVDVTWSIEGASTGVTIDAEGTLTTTNVETLQVIQLVASATIEGHALRSMYEISVLPREASTTVTDVFVKPRWPWNGLVDIDYTIENYPTNSFAFISIEGYDVDDERTLEATTLTGIGVHSPVTTGTYRMTWDIGADYPNFHTSRFTVNIQATPALLDAPTGVTATDGVYENKIVISWNGVEKATAYELYRSTSSAVADATCIATLPTTSYTDVTVLADVTYYYWVRASIGSFKSEYSLVDEGCALQVDETPLADLYVATTGCDETGTGSYTNPYRTLQKAINVAQSGEKICVLAGTYVENITITGKNIHIFSESGAAETIVRSTTQKASVVTLTDTATGSIVEGFTITGGYGNLCIGNMNYYGGGFHCSTSATIRNCIITENNYSDIAFGGGIYSLNGTLTVENCLITKNYAWASGGASLTEGNVGGIIFIGCTVCENNSRNFFGYQGGLSLANEGNMEIINSILWNNGGDDLGAFSGYYSRGTDVTITNSLVDGGISSCNIASIITNGTLLTVNPKLATDYTLASDSPCINVGLNTAVTSEADLSGNLRIYDTTVDLGAYEYGSIPFVPEQSSYMVIYNANGGTGTMPNQQLVCNRAETLALNTFERADYTFIGWSTTSSGDPLYSDGATVTNLASPNQTLTLYALWQKNTTATDIWTTIIEDGQVTITGLNTSNQPILTIPSEIDGYPVTKIAAEAFKGRTDIVSIIVPDSVTLIGRDAFKDCTNLTEIRLPDTLDIEGAALPQSGLVAYYPFTEGSIEDVTGNGHNLVPNGAQPTFDRFGIANNAYAFSGERVFFGTEADPAVLYWDNFTYAVWARTDVVVSEDGDSDGFWQAGNAVIYPEVCESNAGCGLAIGTNGVWLTEHGGCYLPKTLQYMAPIGTGWNHYAVTVENNGAAKLYINGQYVATASQSGRRKAICPTYLGGAPHREIWGIFTGEADDYAFYNRALSPDEINALYHGETFLSTDTLFNGCSSLQTITGCDFTSITLNPQGGSLDEHSTTLIRRHGHAYGALPTPTRQGYFFRGWETAAHEPITSSTLVDESHGQELFASWSEIQQLDDIESYAHTSIPWFNQTTTTYDGISAFQSGAISHNGTTALSMVVIGPTTLSYYCKVSSETNWDFLRFYIDGVLQESISGDVPWTQKTFAIPAGTHTIQWAYTKDGSVNARNDAAWIDCVTLTEIPEEDSPLSDQWDYTVEEDEIIIHGLKDGTYENVEVPSEIEGYPVTTIAAEAFKGRTDVVMILLPDTVTHIGLDAFKDCTNLKTVILPDELTLLEGEIPSNGLIAYYPFTEGSYEDVSGNGTTLVANGAQPTVDRFGSANDAYAFSGDRESFIAAEDSLVECWDNFTTAVWARTDVLVSEEGNATGVWHAGNAVLFPAHGASNAGCGLAIGTDGVWLTEHGDCYLPKTLQYSAPIGTGWNHYAVTVENNGAAKLYINGQYVATASAGRSQKKIEVSGLGGGNVTGQSWGQFTGDADDFIFYNRALTPDEITSLYLGSTLLSADAIFKGCTSLNSVTGANFVVLSFDPQEGTLPDAQYHKILRYGQVYGDLPIPTRPSYTFKGWRTATGEMITSNTILTEGSETHLYAVWTTANSLDNLATYTQTGGTWIEQSDVTYDGNLAFQSPSISHNAETSLSTTVTGPATLSFYWKVSSESGHDYLRFYIDDTLQASISGEIDWMPKTYTLAEGTHTLRWSYTKDVSVNGNADCGWVDCILLTPEITDDDSDASTSATDVSYFTYTSTGNAVTITGLQGDYPAEVIVPAMIEGLPVQTIGDWAFNACTSLTKLTLPEGLTGINDCAFYGCTQLTRVNLSSTVNFVGRSVFDACPNVQFDVATDNEHLTSQDGALFTKDMTTLIRGPGAVDIYEAPEGVNTIRHDAFTDCATLTRVVLPSSVTSIGSAAFSRTPALTTVVMHEGIQSIERHAFRYCSALKSITLPSTLTSLGDDVFVGCSSLDALYFSGAPIASVATNFPAMTGYYLSTYATEWENVITNGTWKNLTMQIVQSDTEDDNEEINGEITDSSYFNYTIDNDVVTITNLQDNYPTEIVIPAIIDGYPVVAIEDLAFYSTTITSVVIPDGITSIGLYAFQDCTALTTIAIPASVTTIGEYAFDGCTALESLYFYGEPASVGEAAFPVTNGYYLSEFATAWEGVIVDNTWNNLTMECLESGEGEPEIATDSSYFTTSLSNGAVMITGLQGDYPTDIVIPKTINNLPVTSIGSAAFRDNNRLTSVVIPEGVVSLGANAFDNCPELMLVKIPSTVMSMGENIFAQCELLKFIVSESNTTFTSSDGALFNKEMTVLYYGPGNTASYDIPASVTRINSFAFDRRFFLTSVTIPEGVESIGGCAFYHCAGITEIEIPSSVRTIGSYALEATSLTTVVIPEGVQTLAHDVFLWCDQLTTVTLPSTLTSIGYNAFYGCTALTTVHFNGGPIASVSTNFPRATGYYSRDYAEAWEAVIVSGKWKNLTMQEVATALSHFTYTIVDGEATITGLQGNYPINIVVPSVIEGLPVTTIAENAFSDCPTVVEIEIPDTVTTIEANAFKDCQSLTTLILPDVFATPNVMPTEGLVAYYPFTDGSVDDATGNGHDLISNGATSTVDRNGVSNGAYAFTGSFDSFSAEEPCDIWENFTVSFWAKTDVAVSHDGDGSGLYSPGNAVLYPRHGDEANNSSYVAAGCGISIGTNGVWLNEHGVDYFPRTFEYSTNIGTDWNHYAITMEDNGAVKLYVNGAYVGAGANTNYRKCVSTKAIGGGPAVVSDSSYACFTGVADDYAFYNRALTENEILALCNSDGLGTILQNCDALTSITGGGYQCLTFDTNGGDFTELQSAKFVRNGQPYGALPKPQREGFFFVGWQTSSGVEITQATIRSESDGETLIAIWSSQINHGLNTLSNYTHSGSNWIEQTATTYDGDSAFQSGAISHYGETSIALTFDLDNRAALSFAWKVSSEANWDYLRFYIDGELQASISGNSDWSLKTYDLSIGTHTIKWAYMKDGSVSSNSDCGWVDSITLTPLTSDDVDAPTETPTDLSYFTYTTSNNTVTITGLQGSYPANIIVPSTINGNPVVAIRSSAFYGDTGITSMVLPEGITTIGSNAFAHCYNMASITLPESLTTIETYAFDRCYALTSIHIPKNVSTITPSAFSSCRYLLIEVDVENNTFVAQDGALFSKDMTRIIRGPGVEHYTIPSTVTTIESYAFDCVGGILTSITIPESVTSMGRNAFSGCLNLESVTLPSNLVSIGINAFYDCVALTSITIPASVTTIDSNVFIGCGNLTEVVFEGAPPSTMSTTFSHGTGYYSRAYATEWESVITNGVWRGLTMVALEE